MYCGDSHKITYFKHKVIIIYKIVWGAISSETRVQGESKTKFQLQLSSVLFLENYLNIHLVYYGNIPGMLEQSGYTRYP